MKNKNLRIFLLILLDVLIVLFSFLVMAKLRTGTRRMLADFVWWRAFFAFVGIWIVGGLFGGKYHLEKVSRGKNMLRQIIQSDLAAVAMIFGLIYVFGQFRFSRKIVLGTMLGTFGLELFIFMGIYYALSFRRENRNYASTPIITKSRALEEAQSPIDILQIPKTIPAISHNVYSPIFSEKGIDASLSQPLRQNYLRQFEELCDFLEEYLDLNRFADAETLILNSEVLFNVEKELPSSRQMFINLHRINDLRRLNVYLIKVSELLKDGGVFICHGQTITERRTHFNRKYSPILGPPLYFLDFLLRRVMPKLPIFQGWYFALTRGQNRALSETEMLGRFYFCGFELVHKREIDGLMHFILKKTNPPRTDQNPSYGPLIRLKRLGQNRKVIYLRKFRTMHPYSEYLQDYVFQTNALQEGGKFKNDFRVTSWGKVMRSLWIDELPQFYNFFRGELALVGVRALSEHYFSLYPPEMQELRLTLKPGLIPPFYADLPQTFEEIVESERRYILAKHKKPFATDWKYFWTGVWNIIFVRARSK